MAGRSGENGGAGGGDLSEPLLGKEAPRRYSELYGAGVLSRLSFSWLNPLLRLGRSKALDLADVPLIASEDGAARASERFAEAWSLHGHGKDGGGGGRLVGVLLSSHKAEEEERRDLAAAGASAAVALVGSLLAIKLAESLSQRHWFFSSRRTGMRVRSALMAAVFRKQLRLSARARRRHSAGEVVGYVAVDAYRLGDAVSWLHTSWSSPLQLALAVATLLWALRLGALPGLVPLVAFGFLNVPFARALQGYQSRFMAAQDGRLRSTSEALAGMRAIKLQSWEGAFRRAVESRLGGEFAWLREAQLKKAYGAVLYWAAPTVVSAVMFAATAAAGSAPLDAGTVFTALAALRAMSEPVRMLPEAMTMMIQYKVSLERIGRFLAEEEIKQDDVTRAATTTTTTKNSDAGIIHVQDGSFSWSGSEAELTLKNAHLSIRRGEKVAVCGPVGSGKSSLLCALLGEIPRTSGMSGTVRDNILFGKPFENFDHGDLTEIGQRGINMSGGQKQRIQLARAVYSDADVYLLDDPFSAVDAHTAAVLFYVRALSEKTVVLVTHQVEFLTETDRILPYQRVSKILQMNDLPLFQQVMEDGYVKQQGVYAELMESGTAFEKLVSAHKSSITALDDSSQQSQVQEQNVTDENTSGQPSAKYISDIDSISAKGQPSATQLTEEEEKEIGDLGWKPYKDYINVSKGITHLCVMGVTQVLFTSFQMMATFWLAVAVQMNVSSALLVGAYSGLSILSCCFAYIRTLYAAKLGLKASKAFFTGLMDSVFKAPMSFFDSTPVGRILTRASSDLSILDFDIPYSVAYVVVGATRDLARINGTTKAPVMNYAAESILAVVTIRSFGETDRFIRNNLLLIDTDATLFFHTVAAQEWVLIRVEALQSLTLLTAALLLVLAPPGAVSPGFAGLSLSFALSLTAVQVFLTKFYSYMENYIISVERIKQYMHLPPEPPAIIPENRAPSSWPQEGQIDLQDLKVRYRPNMPLVLKGITCTFPAGNKIGVVGRTGSGKSTLISSLFRLVDPAGGRILIDNLDISSIGLKDLRTKLSIIPQEPTLFRGTVRNNLDPLGLHSDEEIWEALEKCQLQTAIRSTPALLDTVVSDDGSNWSVGQRQLFCLGRVLLRRNKILVLDEATASIDSATDAIIQRVIRQQFSSCTVVTIAHRVPTVTDSDKVMVLSYGKLIEYDTPAKLLEDKQTAFAKLVAEYWANSKRNAT
ncbi:Os06g0561800 [Oryza sativa Japonica Group]|uniref:Os06g0561800 protein n=1 Tax=Oryza sativa subsp. japonica TaxID=39947 RepID=C7J4D9_ORYSJ|nr:Os06g0561800 [Oryza sativa Japonica Group]|eukprot:NP_001174849.1 Os06g0561800 [Oryza sativa Japonica Group]